MVAASACVGACATLSAEGVSLWSVVAVAGWLCLAWLAAHESAAANSANKSLSALREREAQLARIYHGTTEALTSAIAAKDSHEYLHVVRVRALCEMVAKQLGLSDHETEGLRVGALLHDVGKLGVPEYILLKPGPLDNEEFMRTSNHAAIGAEIISVVDYPWDIAGMVRHHHEHYDGTGYPNHLAGDAIPLGARIIAAAEVYESLTSERCYRQGWTHQQAIEHIGKLAGTHFDPVVVRALVAIEPQVSALRGLYPGNGETDSNGQSAEHCAAANAISRASQELLSLFEIAESLSSTLELEQVLSLLAHRTRRLSRVTTCVVFLADENKPHSMTAAAAVGRYDEQFRGVSIVLGEGMTGRVAQERTAMLGPYDSTDIEIRGPRSSIKLRSSLVVPIVSGENTLGTINLYDSAEQAFTVEDVRTMTLVAGHAALAIQNARAFESIRDTAMKDPLTGLYNGRYLRSYLDHEFSRAERHGDVITLLALDLENFKSINDTFGHARGDEVLRQVADVFRGQVRDYDMVARIGGDEFVVVMPGTEPREAILSADRIRRAIDDYAAEALDSMNLHFGISIGLASYPRDADDLDELLAAADSVMYADKRARKQGLAA